MSTELIFLKHIVSLQEVDVALLWPTVHRLVRKTKSGSFACKSES